MNFRTLLLSLAGAAVTVGLLTKLAHAEPTSDAVLAAEPAASDLAVRQATDPFLRFSLGGRVGRNSSAGYDPFSATDTTGGIELAATARVYRRGPISLAAGLSYDATGSTGSARGATTQLAAYRFAAVAEGRYLLTGGFVPLVRLAPGLLGASQSLADGSDTLHATTTHLSLDGSIGTGILLGSPDGKRRVRAWFVPRIGYAWSTARTPKVAIEDPNAILGQNSGRTLPSLAFRGPYVAAEVALAF
jgi:hypothetical protein